MSIYIYIESKRNALYHLILWLSQKTYMFIELLHLFGSIEPNTHFVAQWYTRLMSDAQCLIFQTDWLIHALVYRTLRPKPFFVRRWNPVSNSKILNSNEFGKLSSTTKAVNWNWNVPLKSKHDTQHHTQRCVENPISNVSQYCLSDLIKRFLLMLCRYKL